MKYKKINKLVIKIHQKTNVSKKIIEDFLVQNNIKKEYNGLEEHIVLAEKMIKECEEKERQLHMKNEW